MQINIYIIYIFHDIIGIGIYYKSSNQRILFVKQTILISSTAEYSFPFRFVRPFLNSHCAIILNHIPSNWMENCKFI